MILLIRLFFNLCTRKREREKDHSIWRLLLNGHYLFFHSTYFQFQSIFLRLLSVEAFLSFLLTEVFPPLLFQRAFVGSISSIFPIFLISHPRECYPLPFFFCFFFSSCLNKESRDGDCPHHLTFFHLFFFFYLFCFLTLVSTNGKKTMTASIFGIGLRTCLVK